MSYQASQDQPVYAVPTDTLVPVSEHLSQMFPIPASRMFLINKSLKVYAQKNPHSQLYDASQRDGGSDLGDTGSAAFDCFGHVRPDWEPLVAIGQG